MTVLIINPFYFHNKSDRKWFIHTENISDGLQNKQYLFL